MAAVGREDVVTAPPEQGHLEAVPDDDVPPPSPTKLRLVDPDGAFREVDGDPLERIANLEAELLAVTDERDGLTEAMRSQGAKLRALRRDKEREAKRSEYWPQAVEAFTYWKQTTGHPRSQFTADRFFLLEPFLKKDGLDLVILAIDGAAYDPHVASRPNRNGKIETYDALETIFKSRASFERHVNRAPVKRIAMMKDAGAIPFRYTPDELRIKAEVILHLEDPWDEREWSDRVADAIARAREELTVHRRKRIMENDRTAENRARADDQAEA